MALGMRSQGRLGLAGRLFKGLPLSGQVSQDKRPVAVVQKKREYLRLGRFPQNGDPSSHQLYVQGRDRPLPLFLLGINCGSNQRLDRSYSVAITGHEGIPWCYGRNLWPRLNTRTRRTIAAVQSFQRQTGRVHIPKRTCNYTGHS